MLTYLHGVWPGVGKKLFFFLFPPHPRRPPPPPPNTHTHHQVFKKKPWRRRAPAGGSPRGSRGFRGRNTRSGGGFVPSPTTRAGLSG